MLCSRCHKRPAVVFLSSSADGSNPQGYCLTCARELGIKPVNDLMDKMGLTSDQMEAMENELDAFMDASNEENSDDADDGDSDGFEPGGAALFPANFLKNIYDPNSGGSQSAPQGGQAPAANSSKPEPKKKKRRHLDTYCTNLTARAKEGKIDRIVGRDKEISRVVQILSRRTKNNPCLIGEPGVGKTAVAEGLALRIAQGKVPVRLQDKEIMLLDLTALVAGTQFRGQFESRIKGLLQEVREAGNIILFIDEVHNLVGTGDAEGSMNAANIMKPALSRGEIQVIGATTFTEYRKYIEKDAALERRFQPVTIEEPSIADATQIILGIKGYYETFHRVRVSDQIARRTVVLSERYIYDRFLPDKAIDLLDEACACAALRNKSMSEYDRLNRQLKDLQVKEENMTAAGENTDFEELARVRTDISRAQQRVEELKPQALGAPVEEGDLAHVIELWTGIPASRVQESEL
ncbi:MAG: ATP-dependent Clp protease ATP-binding subunit, partial [Oscillospiraceae bacterium]|nr:ATP-dependent Clp protease ATP-binding subunit [Oscillospiraceae bacterium]